MLFDDLRNVVVSLEKSLATKIIKQIINNILYKAYGNMIIPVNIKEKIYASAINYIINNNNQLDDLDLLSCDLISGYKQYVSELENDNNLIGLIDFIFAKVSYAIQYENEEAFNKFRKNVEDKKHKENVRKLNNDAKEYAELNFMKFIRKLNSNYYSSDFFKFNIDKSKFKNGYFSSPLGEEIDFELLISCLKEIVNNAPDKERYSYFNKYIVYLGKYLFGNCSIINFNGEEEIDNNINAIEELIKCAVLNNQEIDIDDLNNLYSNLLGLFNSSREKLMSCID